jgi:hypothetical protein
MRDLTATRQAGWQPITDPRIAEAAGNLVKNAFACREIVESKCNIVETSFRQ